MHVHSFAGAEGGGRMCHVITLTHLLDREPSDLCSTEAMMAKHYANTGVS